MFPTHLFDNIYCINLPHRTDRWKKVNELFEKLHIQNNILRIDGILTQQHNESLTTRQKGALGLGMSLTECIKHAKRTHSETILVFEDDLSLETENYAAIITDCMNTLSTMDWDMLYLGCRLVNPYVKVITPNLYQVYNAWTTHAVVYHYTMFDELLLSLPDKEKDLVHNLKWSSDHTAIDVYFSNGSKKMFTTSVPIFSQYNDHSDIEQCVVTNHEFINTNGAIFINQHSCE